VTDYGKKLNQALTEPRNIIIFVLKDDAGTFDNRSAIANAALLQKIADIQSDLFLVGDSYSHRPGTDKCILAFDCIETYMTSINPSLIAQGRALGILTTFSIDNPDIKMNKQIIEQIVNPQIVLESNISSLYCTRYLLMISTNITLFILMIIRCCSINVVEH
jgi:hypothetical protein